MTQQMTAPHFLSASTHSYLERAAESLREAITSTSVPERYAHAHVSALRATAALLAARAQPALPSRRRPQKNAWVLLAEVAPELSEWASFFAAGAAKRAAAETGSRRAVTEREVWRVTAARGRSVGAVDDPGFGVFDLTFDWAEGDWRLARTAD
jgi:hypothetical protein